MTALDEQRRQLARAGVGDPRPDLPREQDGVQPLSGVRRRDYRLVRVVPAVDDGVDRPRVEIGSVGEDHDGRPHISAERTEAAAKGGAGAALPFGAVNGPRVGLDGVRAEHDDDVVHGARANPLEHGAEQDPLLR